MSTGGPSPVMSCLISVTLQTGTERAMRLLLDLMAFSLGN